MKEAAPSGLDAFATASHHDAVEFPD